MASDTTFLTLREFLHADVSQVWEGPGTLSGRAKGHSLMALAGLLALTGPLPLLPRRSALQALLVLAHVTIAVVCSFWVHVNSTVQACCQYLV